MEDFCRGGGGDEQWFTDENINDKTILLLKNDQWNRDISFQDWRSEGKKITWVLHADVDSSFLQQTGLTLRYEREGKERIASVK